MVKHIGRDNSREDNYVIDMDCLLTSYHSLCEVYRSRGYKMDSSAVNINHKKQALV